MDLDTLIAEVDPARRVPLADPDSPEGHSLYCEIIAGRPGRRRPAGLRRTSLRLVGRRSAGWRTDQWCPVGWRGAPWRRRRSVPSPFAVALAAMVLAAAGAAAAVVLGGGPAAAPGGPGRPAPGSAGQPPGLLLAAAMISPPPAGLAAAGLPPYYVTLESGPGRQVADVRGSAAGQVLATVPLPRWMDPKLTKVAAGTGHRRFVLALGSARQTRFYQLRVAPGGHAARLTKLALPPLPAGQFADDIAVSADGSKLAVAIQRQVESRANPGSATERGAVEIVSLTTGSARTWTTASNGLPWDLSWADGGSALAFNWAESGPGNRPGSRSAQSPRSGLWLLDTNVPGTNLLPGHRIMASSVGGDEVQSAVLTPDGSTVIAAVIYNGTGHVGRGTVVGGIVELSARTGRPLRTLLAERAAYSPDAGWYITPCELASIDATGRHLLVNCDGFGRLDRGRFTALPGYPPQASSPAAW